MSLMRHLLLASLLVFFCALPLQAQPSDSQTIRDLSYPGVLSVKLMGKGSKVWSKTDLQYYWERAAVIMRPAKIKEYPNAKLEVGGIATYTLVGGRASFKKFYVTYNSYQGIPSPTAKDYLPLFTGNLPQFLLHHFTSIVGDIDPIQLANEPKWDWGSPNSVSFRVVTGYTEIINTTQLEKKKAVFKVTLYRDAVKSPWNRFVSFTDTETSLGKSTHEADDIRAMKTLEVIAAEKGARARLASLPKVTIPKFTSDLEAFTFINNLLRENNPGKFEAFLRQSIVPNHFVEGSTSMLSSSGEVLFREVLPPLKSTKAKYSEQYGPDLRVKYYRSNWLEFWNADGQHFSRIILAPSGGRYENGVKVDQELKVQDMMLSIATDADTVARLKSIPEAQRFAPASGEKLLSELGGQVAAQKTAAQVTADAEGIRWTPYTSTNARLSMDFPAKPVETEGKNEDGRKTWTVESKHHIIACKAMTVFFGEKPSRRTAEIAVNNALVPIAQQHDGKVYNMSDYSSGTYGRIATFKKDTVTTKVRAFVTDDVMYVLSLSGPNSTMDVLNDRVFFGSFQAGD